MSWQNRTTTELGVSVTKRILCQYSNKYIFSVWISGPTDNLWLTSNVDGFEEDELPKNWEAT